MRAFAAWPLRVGLVVAVSLLLVVAGFASLDAVAGPFVLGEPRMTPAESLIAYAGALVALVLCHGVASWLARRDPGRERFVWWLVGASSSGVVWFGGLALLSASFWSVARPASSMSEAVLIGLLYFVALAGPSLASLAAAVLTVVARARRAPVVLPPAAFLIVASLSVAIPAAYSVVTFR